MEQVTVFFTTISYENHAYKAYGVVDEHHRLDDLSISDLDEPSLVGRIYRAKVVDLVPSMQCAFVLLDGHTKAYLPFSSCDHVLRPDEELLVQVETDAIKSKFAVVSQFYEISGQNCCIIYGRGTHGVSKKLSKKEREEWKAFLAEYDDTKQHILLRTGVKDCNKEQIRAELEQLLDEALSLANRGAHGTCYSLLYQPKEDVAALIRRYMGVYEEFVSDGNFRVITDEREVYEAICASCEGGALSLSSDRIQLYTDASYPLYKLYSLNTQIEKLLQKTVWLDSGANILIESMETMTAIDVNSAKKQWKKSEADHILALNREAGAEIARQLRLRNISGMILIDFVNMTEDAQKEALLASMKSYVRKDSLRVNVVDITKLGLMELTREKVAKSLKQTIKKS